jgi:hypothetical protein
VTGATHDRARTGASDEGGVAAETGAAYEGPEAAWTVAEVDAGAAYERAGTGAAYERAWTRAAYERAWVWAGPGAAYERGGVHLPQPSRKRCLGQDLRGLWVG